MPDLLIIRVIKSLLCISGFWSALDLSVGRVSLLVLFSGFGRSFPFPSRHPPPLRNNHTGDPTVRFDPFISVRHRYKGAQTLTDR
uniref:Uncharacterized protein n=1 Tax=Human herpesvirus 2 TaxID=10310 RepID=A0A481TVJ0_HHV2|nr:hypothetical protein [Human alphaherpesvirus 2]QBH76552.1 hypothetical protein [Human alphaherpesvirus 2]QBH76639.1 hypothetical protein [Human alphaherpesvirus 2]QBH76718.1 hypothetical protein [Human alphaherpesvirus 2]QBH76794.1 hypothetical protein [Human alphaherpesvirus 2]